ncbi:MAG: type II CAAX endopeptidase family protein [Bacilli bacterium]|nr:type II CAAX endopeptidase family protein [Bacilli bacterium]
MNSKVKDLEKVSFGIATMFGLYWIYSCFIKQHLAIAEGVKTIIGLVVLYVLGLGVFLFITRNIPTYKYEKKKVSIKTVILCFLLQFTAIFVLTVLVNVSGTNGTASAINATSLYMLFMLLIFNPIIEEIVFRKLFADKLLKYGEKFYILVSSFCFAIVHGVSLGIPQIVYTFILGMLWSFLMVKTGDIRLVIIMHALSNLFGSVIAQTLMGVSMIAAGLYSMLLILLGIIGLILFLVNKKNINLDEEKGLFRKEIIKDMLTNKGIVFYVVVTALVMCLK